MAVRRTQPEHAVAQYGASETVAASAFKLVGPTEFMRGGRGEVPSKREVSEAAKVVRAQKELLHVAELRLVDQAARSKTSQAALAGLLGTSQPTISRLVKQIAQDPSVLEPCPTETINLRTAGLIDTDTMMEALIAYSYEPGRYDPTGSDGFVRGSWRQIEDALTAGLITDEEYERVAREAPIAEVVRVVGTGRR